MSLAKALGGLESRVFRIAVFIISFMSSPLALAQDRTLTNALDDANDMVLTPCLNSLTKQQAALRVSDA